MNDQIIFDRIENCDQIFSPRKLWERKLKILGWCIIVGEVELMRVLLEKGVEVDCSSDAGPPLIWAAGHEHIPAVEILLDHGANVITFEIPQLPQQWVSCFPFK
jgi:hypothetical protein